MGEESDNKQGGNGNLQMGQTAARAAVDAAKVAAKASTGDVAGAVATAATSPALLKTIGLLAISIVLLVLLLVSYLFSLPTAMFQSVMTTTDATAIVERLDESIYSGEYGTVTESYLHYVAEFLFGGIRSYSQFLATVDNNEFGAETDDIEDSWKAAQHEENQTKALTRKIEQLQAKVDTRLDELYDCAVASGGYSGICYSQFLRDYHNNTYNNTRIVGSNFYLDRVTDKYVFGGASVIKTKCSMSKLNAVKLLCLYTVMKGASLKDVRVSDIEKWLGYTHGFNILGIHLFQKTVTTKINNVWTLRDVPCWVGSCIPQYMIDTGKYLYEKGLLSDPLYYEKNYGVAALDMLVYVDGPESGNDISELTSSDMKSNWIRIIPNTPESSLVNNIGTILNNGTSSEKLWLTNQEYEAAKTKYWNDYYYNQQTRQENKQHEGEEGYTPKKLRTLDASYQRYSVPTRIATIENKYAVSYTYPLTVGVQNVDKMAEILGVADPDYTPTNLTAPPEADEQTGEAENP